MKLQKCAPFCTFNQSINHPSINQSIDQSVNQSINQTRKQPVNWLINQSIYLMLQLKFSLNKNIEQKRSKLNESISSTESEEFMSDGYRMYTRKYPNQSDQALGILRKKLSNDILTDTTPNGSKPAGPHGWAGKAPRPALTMTVGLKCAAKPLPAGNAAAAPERAVPRAAAINPVTPR